jgi:hypothetical protein
VVDQRIAAINHHIWWIVSEIGKVTSLGIDQHRTATGIMCKLHVKGRVTNIPDLLVCRHTAPFQGKCHRFGGWFIAGRVIGTYDSVEFIGPEQMFNFAAQKFA